MRARATRSGDGLQIGDDDACVMQSRSRGYCVASQSYRCALRTVLFAIPTVPVVKDEVRCITGSRPDAHEMLDAGARTHYFAGVEHFDHGCDREQVQLRRCK